MENDKGMYKQIRESQVLPSESTNPRQPTMQSCPVEDFQIPSATTVMLLSPDLIATAY
jgi:hypothetical protein